jgi:hypothetical protein
VRTSEKRLANLAGICSRSVGEQERLGHRLDRRSDDELVASFGDLSGADRPHVHDGLPHRLEERESAVEIGRVAPGHDGKGGLDGSSFAARDGRIEHVNVTLSQRRGDPPGGARIDRAHVDRKQTVRRAIHHASRAEQDLLDVLRLGKHRDHDVASGGHAGG